MRIATILVIVLCLLRSSSAEAQIIQEDLSTAIAQRIVTDDDFARSHLYSWTTLEKVQALRQDHKILAATTTSGDGPTPFGRALRSVAKRKDKHGAIASLLLHHNKLTHRRYAWTSPFATAKPRGKRSYGNYLIHMQLRDESWTGHFEPGKRRPFRFVTSRGDAVSLTEVIEHPERIGSIFHTRRPPAIPEAFREYVVCNPDMLISWSIATEQLADIVRQESSLLQALAGTQTITPSRHAYRQWNHRSQLAQANLTRRYQATLAFDIRHYRVRARNLLRVAEALNAYAISGPALTVSKPAQ